MTQVLAAVPTAGLEPMLVELGLESGSLNQYPCPPDIKCTSSLRRNQPATQGGAFCQTQRDLIAVDCFFMGGRFIFYTS
jgi:hypothetical protein